MPYFLSFPGGKSRHPSEACMDYYFDPATSPVATMVNAHRNARPCPFSGRYAVEGSLPALAPLLNDLDLDLSQVGGDRCHSVSMFMHAGCGGSASSSELTVETTCRPRPPPANRLYYQHRKEDEERPLNDEPLSVRTEFRCHGKWREPLPDAAGRAAAASSPLRSRYDREIRVSDLAARSREAANRESRGGQRHLLMISSGPSLHEEDNSLGRNYLCLAYTEFDGVMLATAEKGACLPGADLSEFAMFNITSSGPCLQALTGSSSGSEAIACSLSLTWLLTAAAVVMAAAALRG